MPVMPRWNKKARKIAWNILGKPNNMKPNPPKQQKLNETLMQQMARHFGR